MLGQLWTSLIIISGLHHRLTTSLLFMHVLSRQEPAGI